MATLTLTVATMSQSNNGHLTFKGVPIDGKLSEFVTKMNKAGFKSPDILPKEYEEKIRNAGWGGLLDLAKEVDANDKYSARLEGDFAGYSDCSIYVNTLKSTDIVSNVTVIFPYRADWTDLKNDYSELKEMLTEKYGNPSACVEDISNVESFYTRKDALETNKKAWFTKFSLPNGDIILSLQTSNVALQYIDKANSAKKRANAIADL
jgi:hypothetical protein